MSNADKLEQLAELIPIWGRELGFQAVGITDTNLHQQEKDLQRWLDKGYQGDMKWMGEHGNKRSRPDELLPGTKRVISARMNYLAPATEPIRVLKDSSKAYVSRYALGRDYHKLIRKRLSQLAKQIEDFIGREHGARAFVDSAPVMERPLAEKAGLGWTGKHTLLINREAGSWFFLGEIFTNLELPLNQEQEKNQCGDCKACLQVCPTDAFPKPYVLDARRCISYLTIEYDGLIPEEFRDPIGNRVFGCDDCQAICPWNKYAQHTHEQDFLPRHKLHDSDLLELFSWNEEEFLQRTAGSPLRRIGYQRWQRNLAIGLGNAKASAEAHSALTEKLPNTDAVLAEHFRWAITQQENPQRRRKRKIKRPDNN
ncbi:tRNA epoxyqueuosine(34) reductase QueG [Pseudoteredinibacter isoporae]|uniref:Epoxyqueuosine reductase n=1 Tax=Pseudoteredinibacter isoporae TaxID=570281 RepID=A0A7X0MUU4_9GAMM|nr:tRNA epoxyqueuosine(34) reductase QueG [Pseudoteredinibacter isoporae]MBB6520668.1 epoxyqueuosine reductase [Pseudoteredinibacter isoporae]NHO86235.1 tRNA epoxyqueuosine(34) reductase QueG [Pseudoteredinibacter isoporae]NIB25314.1 tRNA epoxyqueuosine(34) reductase QueG [Pseudoteredinibacter isoporae]